jgi:hypothetical protein
MIRSRNLLILATAPRPVILGESDEDARRISTYNPAPKLSALQGCKSEGNQ